MSTSLEKAKNLIALFSKLIPFEKVLDMVTQDASGEKEKLPRIPEPLSWSREAMEKRQDYMQQHTGISLSFLSGGELHPELRYFVFFTILTVSRLSPHKRVQK